MMNCEKRNRLLCLWFAARVLSASALALQGCSVEASATSVTVTSIGYEAASSSPSMAWIDNNQLLFFGQKSGPDPRKGSFAAGKIYLWNDDAKSARLYAEDSVGGFCFSQGRISFIVSRDKEKRRVSRIEGLWGAEKKVEQSSVSEMEIFSNFRCRTQKYDNFMPPLPKDRATLVLRDGDGYLTLSPFAPEARVTQPKNIVLYPEDGTKPVPLPISWREDIGLGGAVYSEYLRAYILHPGQLIPSKGPANWPVTEPRVVYVLYPAGGKVERVEFPPTESFGFPRPIQGGWIYLGGDFYKTSGLYVRRHKVIRKIDTGNVRQIAISPDGCKAAVAINSRHLETGTPTPIKIFHFC